MNPPPPAQQLTRRTTVSAALLVGSRLATRMIDFVTLLLLARLLTPVDFGIIAIALTLVQMLETIFDVPIVQVYIRSPQVEPSMLDTAFTLGLLRSLLLITALAACSLPFASLYHDGRLVGLITFLSLAPAFRGLVSPAMATFARELDFRRDVIIEVTGKLVGFTGAIGGALMLHSFWAIAFGTVATPVTMAIVSYIVAPYRPRFSLGHWRMYSGFLGWFTVSQLIAATNWKLSRLVLGVYVTKGVLGAFSMAGDLCAIPEQALIRPTIRPLASGFAKLQHDPQRLSRAYMRAVSTILAIGLPPLLAMAMLARPAVRLAMGPKWQATPPIITWLALLACLALVTAAFNALCVALGQTRRIFLTSLVDLAVRLPATVLMTRAYGMTGTIAAQFLATGVYMLAVNRGVRQMTGLGFAGQWSPLSGALLSGAVMTGLLWWLRAMTERSTPFELFVATALVAALGVGAYLACLMALWVLRGRPEGGEAMLAGASSRLAQRLVRRLRPAPSSMPEPR